MDIDGTRTIHGSVLAPTPDIAEPQASAVHLLGNRCFGSMSLRANRSPESTVIHQPPRAIPPRLHGHGENTNDSVHHPGDLDILHLLMGNPQANARHPQRKGQEVDVAARRNERTPADTGYRVAYDGVLESLHDTNDLQITCLQLQAKDRIRSTQSNCSRNPRSCAF